MKGTTAPVKTIGDRLATALAIIQYAVPGLLFLLLVYKLVAAAIVGVPPVPQIPPDGYVASDDRIALYWRRGSHEGDFTLQVAQGDRFDAPIVTKTTNQTTYVLPRLKPNTEYCWRVVDDPGARRACFTTEQVFVPY